MACQSSLAVAPRAISMEGPAMTSSNLTKAFVAAIAAFVLVFFTPNRALAQRGGGGHGGGGGSHGGAVADPTAAVAGVFTVGADLEAAGLTVAERIAAAVDSAGHGPMAAVRIAAEAATRRAAMAGPDTGVMDLAADRARPGLPARAMLSLTVDGIPLETADARRVPLVRRELGIPRLQMAGGTRSEQVTVQSLQTHTRLPRGERRRASEPLA